MSYGFGFDPELPTGFQDADIEMRELEEWANEPRCPACFEAIDYCQGHGEMGDPAGFALLQAHDAGDHRACLTICD